MFFDLVEREDSEYTPLGKPFDMELKISNKSSEKRTVDVTLIAGLVWYNGRAADNIKRENKDVVCDAGNGKLLLASY